MSDETFNPTNELEHARMRQSQQEYLDLQSQNQALQERVEELTVGLNEAIGHLTANEWKHDASSLRRTKAVKEATRALSPTQETDGPPCNASQHAFETVNGRTDKGTICRCGERYLDYRADVPSRWLMAAGRPTQETDPPFIGTLNETIAYLKEPTQETDPE